MPKIDLSALFNLPPEEAIAAFEAKGFKLSWDWHDTWREANAQSFTVAKLVKMDVLQDIGSAIKVALAEGQTQRMFDKDLTPILMNKGWWGKKTVTGSDGEPEIVQEGSPRRLQTIFRANLQTAYAAGRWKEFENNKADRPYLQYVAIMDSRTRPAHAAMNGKVFPIDSPIWDVIAPSNGFNCRCRLRALSAKNLTTRGLSVETEWEIIERTDPELIPVKRSGELDPKKLVQRGVSIPDPSKPGQKLTLWADPGWDYNPGQAGAIEANLAKVEKQKLAQASPGLRAAYSRDVTQFKQPKPDGMHSIYDPGATKIAADVSTPARSAAVAIENEIRNNPNETGAFISQAGEVLLRKEGVTDAVSFAPQELFKMMGTTFTHNHPNGTSFSYEGKDSDLGMALIWDMAEIRAVSEQFRHVAQPLNGAWPDVDALEQLYPEAEKYAESVVGDMVKTDQLDYINTDAETIHQILLFLAKRLGFIYKREAS